MNMDNKLEDLFNSIAKSINGEIKWDKATRILYSTDASIYRIEPIAVVFPRALDDLNACVELSARYNVPILARGAGSSLAGQAVGRALIMDCSRYLYRHISIEPGEHTATADAGVILASLNKAAAFYGLQFGPDPASAERATLGGSVANNATGAHSILYGMAADQIRAVEVVLSDGSQVRFESIPIGEAVRRSKANTREGAIYRAALTIRHQYADLILAHWPKTWRRAGGYNLNYLIPWSPSRPPFWGKASSPLFSSDSISSESAYPPINDGCINLAPLVAGSEGTLAVIRRCELNLVKKPQYTSLVVLGFPDATRACEQIEVLLDNKPSAIELIPSHLIQLARQIPAYAHQLSWIDSLKVDNDVPTLLVIEFSGDDPGYIQSKAEQLLETRPFAGINVSSIEMQKQVWGVRKVGLGILMSRAWDEKPVPFIEDISIPIEKLSTFVAEMNALLKSYGTQGDFYAHASAGCLHLRPLLNLKTPAGIKKMREIASHAVELVINHGGSISGEHGAGLSRSEWLPKIYGDEIMKAFQLLKTAADPDNILNPGKILNAPPMHVNLRYSEESQPNSWDTILDFSHQNGLIGAVELCNGAGVCRKDIGVMCPSYQVTREEMHSPRGRANLLRSWIDGELQTSPVESQRILFNALDLCLACKGCKAECPSSVDIAKLKYAYLEYFYSHEKRKYILRDYLFAYLDKLAKLGATIPLFGNPGLQLFNRFKPIKKILGLASQRELPCLAENPLTKRLRREAIRDVSKKSSSEKVLLLIDPFTEYFNPDAGMAAIRILDRLMIETMLIPVIGSGRTLISKGFLKAARAHAERLIQVIEIMDPEGNVPIIGIEPSEIYTLKDEFLDFFPDKERASLIADRAFLIDEFLIRAGWDGQPRLLRIDPSKIRSELTSPKVYLHGHCYQKAQPPHPDGFPVGPAASRAMLEILGYRVEAIEAGCCGMAGAFGYEAEHYDLSMQIGELALFPAVRGAERDAVIAATGFSCQTQIYEGTGRKVWHPIQLVDARLEK